MKLHLKVEKGIAVASFLAAVAFAFTALLIREQHDIESGIMLIVAQFLTLTATLFGIDYKFTAHGVSGHIHGESNAEVGAPPR